jgi:hypothetical protein
LWKIKIKLSEGSVNLPISRALERADKDIKPIIALFKKARINYSFLSPTPTGLRKSYMDAVTEFRNFLKLEGLHDFSKQKQNIDDAKKLDAIIHTGGKSYNTYISLNRPGSGNGDPRIRIEKLPDYAKARNLLAFTLIQDDLHIINCSTSEVETFISEYIVKNSDLIISQTLYDLGKSNDKNFVENLSLRLQEIEETDSKSQKGQSRKEQAILRQLLFGNKKKFECALCHKILPIEIMIAAHIKPRKKCSLDERKDPNIVMPVCKIGCDDLFEKGYLKVDDEGRIEKNKTKLIPTALNSFMQQYQKKTCKYFKQSTKQYFKDKRKI